MAAGQQFNKQMKKELNQIYNWIDGKEAIQKSASWIDKYNPHNGKILYQVIDSTRRDVHKAITIAQKNYSSWSDIPPPERGKIIQNIGLHMKENAYYLSKVFAIETGKPIKDAIGELNGAIMQANFFAGEGMRLYGKSLPSSIHNKYSHTIRESMGVAALIVPANTPIANIAWKVFPALICGNTVVLKASEDAPKIAMEFAKLCKKAGLPDGVLNVIHGNGSQAGEALVLDKRVPVISFTGSTVVGQRIASLAGSRLAKVSLELGGINPLVVCADADIDNAVEWAILSAFSNAGQRCAAASRIIVFDEIYTEFKRKLLRKTKQLKLGVSNHSDLGPVVNKKQQLFILDYFKEIKSYNGKILCGGRAGSYGKNLNGYYIEPTLIENVNIESKLSNVEVFGPVAMIFSAKDIDDAIALSNSSEYGLTGAIHTSNLDNAMNFAHSLKSGVVNINLGTYGSEPHMPFGGSGLSGNGTREPGEEALNIYSELKNISYIIKK